MIVYMTAIDLYYFSQGEISIAYLKEPIGYTHSKRINIMKEEVIKDIGANRILVSKKI